MSTQNVYSDDDFIFGEFVNIDPKKEMKQKDNLFTIFRLKKKGKTK